MASLRKSINKNFFDNILPEYGKARVSIPNWNEAQKMFICEEYKSTNGHLYYKGLRFCNNIAIVELVGLFHNWTYIDGIELYAFNGDKLSLIQKKKYDKVFYDTEFIRKEIWTMVKNYILFMMKMTESIIHEEEVDEYANNLVERSYKSFLEPDYNTKLTRLLPNID